MSINSSKKSQDSLLLCESFRTHRLSTTRLADYIIMLEKGRIAEQGTHEGLLKMNGKYAQMWRVVSGVSSPSFISFILSRRPLSESACRTGSSWQSSATFISTFSHPYACETSLYVQKIRDFLGYEPKIVSGKGLLPSQGAKEIELQGVSFAYRKDEDNLLKDISLHIKPGQKIALVGYNGAGKTTLVKLLMRLYDVGEGRIIADGVDIAHIPSHKA